MSATITTLALTRLLTPLANDIYKGASGKAKDALRKWSTSAGIKKAAATLAKVDKVKTIWSPEQEVSLDRFYYPSRLSTKMEISTEFNFLEGQRIDVLPEGNIVIEGIVGQGKSIFMRHLASSMLKSEPSTQIPALIELRTITEKRSLRDAILNLLTSWDLSAPTEALEYLASHGKIVLMLDGFDEIPSECIPDTILEIETMQARFPEMKIIISSRPRHHIQNVVGFKVLELDGLKEEDYDPFIAKLIASPSKRFDVVQALHECADNIKGVITTPLMLTLVVIVYQTEKEIPTTLSDFFEKLFGTVFAKHDKLKAGFNRQHHTGLSERKLKQLFDSFCFIAIQLGGGRSLDTATFERAFDNALMYTSDCKCELEDFRSDIVGVACLMQEEGLDTTTFLHKSILEYHAAAFVKSLSDERARQFYVNAFENYSKWRAPLEFLQTIDQIRYARYYIIGCTKPIISELDNMLKRRDDEELVKYIEEWAPGIYFGFEDGIVAEFGNRRPKEIELSQELSEVVPEWVMNQLSDSTEIAKYKAKIRKKKNHHCDLPMLVLEDFIRLGGGSGLWKQLSGVHHNYETLIEQAERLVEDESQKGAVFMDILAQPSISHLDL